MLVPLLIIAAVAACFTQAQQDFYEGSQCSNGGIHGTCRLLMHCPQAVEDLQKRQKRPLHCSFENVLPVVCCLNQLGVERPANDTVKSPLAKKQSTPTTAWSTSPSPRIGRIAVKKCEEFKKYLFKDEPTFSLSWLARKENKTQCADPGDAFVTGGKEANPKEFPHMAMVGYGDRDNIKYECGGALISPLFVLTAAHCTPRNRPARWVMLGELDRSTEKDDARPELLEVSGVELHPDYTGRTKYFDIALLRLEKEPVLSGYVRPACLHTERSVSSDTNPIATGWGHLWYGGDPSDRLMKVRLPVQDYSKCNQSYDGDSGGPLQLFTAKGPLYCMHHIIGVTSFGPRCGTLRDTPAVYSRVSSFISWIENIVWPEKN
ncbi:venom protease-like isoform X2 [Frankliniella occidentalis]|uniref:Venom protease-like isoform X2 n=1 Tax=Frankliniella occidentalis TaxID=133901 RepID=A0A9C6X046_FRAOC|nr:venom protease-like isoform X2 [Frankliniella occidentalis]